MTGSLFVVTDTPAPLGGMAFPDRDTDWHALQRRGFRHVVRLHPAAYDAAPLTAHDVELQDLHGGLTPHDATSESRRVWDAARLTAGLVMQGDGVVVHCLGGTGRTGTVVACALRLLGRSAQESIESVQAHRPRWPESAWQEEVVRGGPD